MATVRTIRPRPGIAVIAVMAGPEGNGYKNVLDLIITLVVVNFNKFFSYTD